ncbi:hypothetical protein B0F90DRAFT_1739706 [Multifurca ochricompacta]|uniref:RRM domain-containing protein n=1 Tax=Multifurca ochricompacta TaxID=376703 RepID=A0AAD4M076_9AGAM|nr:hypothetical protein B0F90DRAFT_1783879 [Multifurca ochricompacta]KAI0297479.1 hypothetical protein B0F90DRAFT_1739706 [Multifurca ochricompacta]
MAPFKSSGKSTAKSRASDDTVWVHDRAPGAPRNATHNKLMITNLHYEITPKDLTAIFGQIGTLVREPFIRYDRSGRSSGVAIITFETLAEATRAKKQLDGQPISIEFDQGGPRHARAPASSLLSRIQKPPLLNRLSQAQNDAKASLIQSKRVSSIRGRGRGPGTGPARGRISTPLPKSAAELDSELDAFMSVDSGFATPSTKPAENGDMEMA